MHAVQRFLALAAMIGADRTDPHLPHLAVAGSDLRFPITVDAAGPARVLAGELRSDFTVAAALTDSRLDALVRREGLGVVAMADWSTIAGRGRLVVHASDTFTIFTRFANAVGQLPDLARAPAPGSNTIGFVVVSAPRVTADGAARVDWHSHGGDVHGFVHADVTPWDAQLIELSQAMRLTAATTRAQLSALTRDPSGWNGARRRFQSGALSISVRLRDLRPTRPAWPPAARALRLGPAAGR